LREAKQWLRTLPREEALAQAAELNKGLERGAGARPLPRPVKPLRVSSGEKADRPYAHPYYWAAFILIGDPY
jgi:CHAT domain-containing protein